MGRLLLRSSASSSSAARPSGDAGGLGKVSSPRSGVALTSRASQRTIEQRRQIISVAPVKREEEKRHEKAKLIRAQRRVSRHRNAHAEAQQMEVSFLALNSVRESTLTDYRKCLEVFRRWLQPRKVEELSGSDLGRLLTEYWEELYFAGPQQATQRS